MSAISNINSNNPHKFEFHDMPLSNSKATVEKLPNGKKDLLFKGVDMQDLFKKQAGETKMLTEYRAASHHNATLVYDNVVRQIGERYRELGQDPKGVSGDVVRELIDDGLHQVALHFIADTTTDVNERNKLLLIGADQMIKHGNKKDALSLLALHAPKQGFHLAFDQYAKSDLFGEQKLGEISNGAELPKTIAGQLAFRIGVAVEKGPILVSTVEALEDFLKYCYNLSGAKYDGIGKYDGLFTVSDIVKSPEFEEAVILLKNIANSLGPNETLNDWELSMRVSSWEAVIKAIDEVTKKYK